MTAKRKPATNKTAQPNAREGAVWVKAFLAALRRNGVVTSACEAAGIGRTTAYDKRNADPDFKDAWEEALIEAADRIEAEVIRRAVDGYDAPVWYKGQLVGVNREFSDQLAQFVLKGQKPDKYGDKITIKVKPEWLAALDEAGVSASDILEGWVQRYAKAKQQVNNES